MANEIKLILTIDDMQSAVKLKGTDASIIAIQNSLLQLQKNPAIKALTNDLLTLDKVTVESADAVLEFAKAYGLSEKQLSSMINTLRTSQSVLTIGTKEYDANVRAINNVSGALSLLTQRNAASGNAVAQTRMRMGSFNSVIGQTSFLLSDMDMFFVNWRMGLMSVGNNISMVTSTIGYAMNEAKSQGLSFGQAMKQSLTGFNLWILGINAGLFVITALSRLLGDTTSEVKKQKDEVAALEKEYAQLSTTQTAYTRGKLIQQLGEKGAVLRGNPFTSSRGWDVSGVSGDNKDAVDKLLNSLKALDQQAEITSEKIGNILMGNWNFRSISSINEAIKLLKAEYENAETETARKFLKNYIDTMQKRADELGLKDTDKKEHSFIRTNAQIEKEIKQIKSKADATKDLGEKTLYLLQIEERREELKFRAGIGNQEVFDLGDRTPGKFGKIKKLDDEAAEKAGDRVKSFLTRAGNEGEEADRKFQHLNRTLTYLFSNAIAQGKTFGDVLADLGNMALSMGLNFFMGGLFGFLGGKDFVSSGLKILGLANGGVINEPVFGIGANSGQSYAFGEGGIPEVVMPMNRLSQSNYGGGGTQNINVIVTGELKGEGTSLKAVLRRLDKLEGLK